MRCRGGSSPLPFPESGSLRSDALWSVSSVETQMLDCESSVMLNLAVGRKKNQTGLLVAKGVCLGFTSACYGQKRRKTGRSANPGKRLRAGGFAAAGTRWALRSSVRSRSQPRVSARTTCFCHLVALPERLKNGPGEPRCGDGPGQEGRAGGEVNAGYLCFSSSLFPGCYSKRDQALQGVLLVQEG